MAAVRASAAAGGPESPSSGSGGAPRPDKESYWAQDSQGGDVIYTTDTLLRYVACHISGVH